MSAPCLTRPRIAHPPLRRAASVLAAWLLLFPLLACGAEGEAGNPVSRANPVVPLDTGTVLIATPTDTFTLSVEIAETGQQRQIGLMERVHLPADEGMIFLSAESNDPGAGFWMFRTRIPLDIAYLGADGTIVSIRHMVPCESPYGSACPHYPAGTAFHGALEVNAGYFEAHDITPGHRVTLLQGDRVRSLGPDDTPVASIDSP